jgi:hypothetical protein
MKCGVEELDYSYHTKASPGSSIEVHMVLRKLVMSTIAGEIASFCAKHKQKFRPRSTASGTTAPTTAPRMPFTQEI